MDYLLSRHPIFMPQLDVAAYEVRSHAIPEKDGDVEAVQAERSMLSLVNEGLDEIVGSHSCFARVTREAIVGLFQESIPSKRVVVGYFDDFALTDTLAGDLLNFVDRGGQLAISGELGSECLEAFGERAHTIRVDVKRHAPDELNALFGRLRQYPTKLLADGIDTYDDLEFCKDLGFDLYQGHFISRSSAKPQEKQVPVNRMTMLRVLSQLQNPDVSMADLERTIALDATLTYKLLTYCNSAAVSLPRTITSPGHALRLIGLRQIRAWASVLLLSSVDDKPRELMTIALMRGRMCERLSESFPNADKESFFSAGLLSIIDALLDSTMDAVMSNLPLAEEVRIALVDHAGPIGQALRCVKAYERSDWENVNFYGLAPGKIREIYVDSINWARQLSAGMLSS